MFIHIFPSGPLATNAILIGCPQTKKAAIIDPSEGSFNALVKRVEKEGFHVEKILLTHSHWDHFADAHLVKEKFKAPLYVHELDAKNVEEPGSDQLPSFLEIEPVKVDGFFKDGQVIEIGSLKFEVIHSPGHSPGGVCFYNKEENLLISGDTLFQGSMGSISLPTADPKSMQKSLEKLSALPPNTRVIPGHGDETSIGEESWLKQVKQLFSE